MGLNKTYLLTLLTAAFILPAISLAQDEYYPEDQDSIYIAPRGGLYQEDFFQDNAEEEQYYEEQYPNYPEDQDSYYQAPKGSMNNPYEEEEYNPYDNYPTYDPSDQEEIYGYEEEENDSNYDYPTYFY